MANMAKRVNVGEAAKYRKIDVDALDEDRYVEDETTDSSADNAVNQRASEVRSLLNKGDAKGAVLKALENPPANTKNQATKEKNLLTVMDALAAVKTADISGITKGLSPDNIDVLMKYLYAGMANPAKFNSGTLLAWHEKTVEHDGLGSIVRVLADRKTVV